MVSVRISVRVMPSQTIGIVLLFTRGTQWNVQLIFTLGYAHDTRSTKIGRYCRPTKSRPTKIGRLLLSHDRFLLPVFFSCSYQQKKCLYTGLALSGLYIGWLYTGLALCQYTPFGYTQGQTELIILSYFFKFMPTKDLAPFSIHTPQKTLF